MKKYRCTISHQTPRPTKANLTGFVNYVVGEEYSFENPPPKKYFKEIKEVAETKTKNHKREEVKNGKRTNRD